MDNLQKIIQSLDTEIIQLTPVEWAEQNRVLTSDVTPFPGPMNYDRTPYLKEIANSIMEQDPARVITVMKGAQIGFSIGGIFTMIGWIIAQSPGNILFMAGDDDLVKKAITGPIDQMINSSGISHLIRASNVRGGRNQKSGDTIKGKEFPGGSLTAWSGQSLNKLRQVSMRYGFIDDFEKFKFADKSAGSATSLVEQRFAAYAYSRKIFYISTPEIKQTSNIEPMFLKGDQRKYFVPCPVCGEFITLEWQVDVEDLDKKAGVSFKRDEKGNLIEDSVGYVCQKCGGFFKELHKYEIVLAGQWQPTAEPISKEYRSYHISALYAPPGMYNWTHYAQKWCEIHPLNEPIKREELKTFINTCLGQTWEEYGKSPEVTQLAKNTRNYKIGYVPDKLSIEDGNGKIVLLTCAVDLNGKTDDARLDYEIVAWSESGANYSIDHGSIGTFQRSKNIRSGSANKHDSKEDQRIKYTYQAKHTNNVWDLFTKEILSKIYLSEDGKKFRIVSTGIDTGHFTIHAYSFIKKSSLFFGLKGSSDNKFSKFDSNKSYFKLSQQKNNLYILEVNKIKDDLSDIISLSWDEKSGIDQPDNFMNFPAPENDKYNMKTYFSHYEGEKRDVEINTTGTAIGSRWVKKHSSSINHFWDCRVYNIAVKSILTNILCKNAKVPVSWNNVCQMLK